MSNMKIQYIEAEIEALLAKKEEIKELQKKLFPVKRLVLIKTDKQNDNK